jgi:hypothetical protein
MVNTTIKRRYLRITGLLLIIIWIVFVQKKERQTQIGAMQLSCTNTELSKKLKKVKFILN